MRLRPHGEIDEIEGRGRRFQHAPALQPVEGALHLVEGDRRGIAHHDGAFAEIVDGEDGDLRVVLAVVINEIIVEIGADREVIRELLGPSLEKHHAPR